MYTLRPFEQTDSDYETITAIRNNDRPDEVISVELFKHFDDARPTKFAFHRDFISRDGVIVACGNYGQNETTHKANKFFFNVILNPEQVEDQDVTQFYLDYVLKQLADKDLHSLVTRTREDRPDRIRALEASGFTRQMRYPISKLDIDTFDFGKYETKVKAIEESGIEVINVLDLEKAHPEDWQKIYYDLDNEIVKDVPMPDEYVPDPIDVFIKDMFEHPAYIPEANFIAREGDKYVGVSNLWKDSSDDTRLWTGLTGVLRSHRRRGVATILKINALKFAKQYGAKVVRTDNEENNPMYQINVQLGFTPLPAHLDYEKSLKHLD